VERCQGLSALEDGMPVLCEAIKYWASSYGLPVPESGEESPGSLLSGLLYNWSALVAPKPLVVLFDEVDILEGQTMISFLRQLRGGFADRGVGKFPVSIALVGMRDLKDYITKSKDGVAPNPGSPFNIKEDSALLSNFLREDIAKLFAQRTEETGQRIAEDALDYAWEQSRGQPWIVNSLFKRATMRVLQENDYSEVTLDHIKTARRQMILARETHLDALAVRIKDPSVRFVMETLITGEPNPALTDSEGFRLCEDLGLVTKINGTPSVANPMYREVLARQLTFAVQDAIPQPEWQWEKPDGALDMDALMREFQKFWRKNSEIWEQKSDYTEAFPHLLLMAFLQRVLNGGGRIEREYAAGRGRMDLYVEYKTGQHIIEIKVVHSYDDPEEVLEEGLSQTSRYRDKLGKEIPSYLVIFDRRPAVKQKAWNERLTWDIREGITVIGC
jgi:hypothetical protein